MKKETKKKDRHLLQIEKLRLRLEETEETLRAIREGQIDALVVSSPQGEQVYTLKSAEQPYRVFVETMNEGAVTLGLDGTILYCNNRFAKMLEIPSDKVIGSAIFRFIPSTDRSGFESAFERGKQQVTTVDISLKRAGQELIPVHLSFNMLHGQEMPVVCMVAMDLTEYKRLEEALRQLNAGLEKRVQDRTAELEKANETLQAEIVERKRAEEELQRAYARLRTLFDHRIDGIGIVIANTEGDILEANDYFLKMLGSRREELKAGKIRWNEITPPEWTGVDKIALAQLRERGVADPQEKEYLRRDGTRVPIFLTAAMLPGQGNEALVLVLDITERKRTEAALRRTYNELEKRVQERTSELARANTELKEEIVKRERTEQQLLQAQKLESMGVLTGGIAHDFNNILGPIIINSEMVLSDHPEGPGVRSNLELILASSLRGRDLVRQMLLFSRKSEKKQELITLSPIIKETFKLLRSSVPTTIQMELQLKTESDTVYADPSQIQQVIMNLCTNAAYAMRGTTGSIDISLDNIRFGPMDLPEPDMQPGDYLILSVKDTGAGMDEEVRTRVFEPFFTTKPVEEGTGLGLSVVYGIVKSHRGSIKVYSEPGRGSVFRVYLPKSEPGILKKAETLKPVPRGSERILFVDDEELIVHSVRNMLQRLGYKITALNDSREALKLFSADPSQFDLVMTDQTMPFMTGEDLGKELMRIRSDIPVILCTGYADFISSEKATAMGFQGFIMKPFTVREGAELVRHVLDQKQPSNEQKP